MRTKFFGLVLLIIFGRGVAAADVACDVLNLAPNSSIRRTSYRLGKMQLFVNETDSQEGYQLLTGDKEIAWTNHAQVAGDKLFFRKCVKAANSDWAPEKGVYGDCPHEWFYLESKKGDFKPRPVQLPGYKFISHGVFCGQSLAYYSIEKSQQCKEAGSSKIEGALFNLQDLKVVKRVDLGCLTLETDNEGHFLLLNGRQAR